ncbi:hypothetical protein AHAS_Ahas09G0195700 [Arachis hypogaea]
MKENENITAPDIGCLVSTPKDSGGNRRKPGSIGEVSVYVPGLRIPKPVDFAQSLGDHLSKKIVERLSALRTRIVVMASQEGPTITRTKRKSATQHGGSTLLDLLQALEDYLPVLLGLVNDGSHLQYKVQFVWVNQEDDAEETTMSNGWYEVLSVLHLMAMLLLSQANFLLLPRSSTDGYQLKVSEESRRASVDIFLKAAGYLDCAVKHVLPQLPAELRRNLPVDLAEGTLRALSLQALGQAIVSIKKGAYLLKCGRRGKPKLCPFRLSPIRCQRQNEAEKECHSFSLIYADGEHSLDLVIFVISTLHITIFVFLYPFQESKFLKFLGFMWNPLSWVTDAAAIMAIALANGEGKPPDWQDFVGIITLLVINSTIMFFLVPARKIDVIELHPFQILHHVLLID